MASFFLISSPTVALAKKSVSLPEKDRNTLLGCRTILSVKATERRRKKGADVTTAVNPKPSKGLASLAVDLLEKAVVFLMRGSDDHPNYYLSGNYAPVKDETPPCTGLPVHGSLPYSQSNKIFHGVNTSWLASREPTCNQNHLGLGDLLLKDDAILLNSIRLHKSGGAKGTSFFKHRSRKLPKLQQWGGTRPIRKRS